VNRPTPRGDSPPPLPALVLLPGLDGTGTLFSEFVRTLGSSVDTRIVAYPLAQPLGYDELETLVLAELPRNQPFVLLGESFSGPAAVRAGTYREIDVGLSNRYSSSASSSGMPSNSHISRSTAVANCPRPSKKLKLKVLASRSTDNSRIAQRSARRSWVNP
jgi:hypothetical protein